MCIQDVQVMQMQWESPCKVQPDLILAADVLYDPGKCLVSYAVAHLRSCIHPWQASLFGNLHRLALHFARAIWCCCTDAAQCLRCSHNCTIGTATETAPVQC